MIDSHLHTAKARKRITFQRSEMQLIEKRLNIEWQPLIIKRGGKSVILNTIAGKGFAYGAFCEGKVVGYILIFNEFFGSSNQYMDLHLFHVSEPYRMKRHFSASVPHAAYISDAFAKFVAELDKSFITEVCQAKRRYL